MAGSLWKTIGAAASTLTLVTAGAASATEIFMQVAAYMDGRDELIIKGDTFQWEHLDYFPVGYGFAGNANYPTLISINNNFNCCIGINWTPVWIGGTPPNTGPGNASGAISNPYTWSSSVDGFLLTQFTDELGRDILKVAQSPSSRNGYTTIIDFNDDASAGPDWYVADLAFSAAGKVGVPEISTWAMTLIGFGSVGGMLRRRASAAKSGRSRHQIPAYHS